MVEIYLQRTISAPISSVFDWLADPANFTTAPLALRAGYAKDSAGPGVGAVREALAVGFWFREAITAYDRPRSYSYLILRSFPAFRHQGGTLTFTPTRLTPSGDGTHVEWVSAYTHPAYAGGKLMEQLTSRMLPMSFHAILRACARSLEPPAQE